MKIIKFLSLGCLVSMMMLLMGCENTVSGFGKDMQKTGQEIQKSVNS